jgi:hypothetical protein
VDTDTQTLQRLFFEVHTESSGAAAPVVSPVDDDVVRSENNILQWMAYLPEDCIRTMIQMGWDVST